MKKVLAKLPGEGLQHLSLLVCLVLIVAAKDFILEQPAISALVVFLFSLPYLAASVFTRRAHLLYATMLLGAVSYFFSCHALGAPGASLPLFSVPLVICLWAAAHRLKAVLPPTRAAFPRTVFRAMNITVAVFAVWALAQAPELLAGPSPLACVAGLTLLSYAAVYLACCLTDEPVANGYAFAAFLAIGSALLGAAVRSPEFSWAPTMASAAVIVLVGAENHRVRGYRWSRHFYLCAVAAVAVATCLSLCRLASFLQALSLGSLVLWLGYLRLAAVVPRVTQATTAERAAGKVFFLGALALAAPVVIVIFAWPTAAGLPWAALILAAVLAGMAWRRPAERGWGRNLYAWASLMFLSAAAMAGSRALPGRLALAGMAASLLLLLAVLALTVGRQDEKLGRGLAEGAVFPVFFGWYVALLHFGARPSVVLAVVALGAVLAARVVSKNKHFLIAVGVAGAGAVVAPLSLLASETTPAWLICALCAAAAAAGFVWAERRQREICRLAAGAAWLVLAIATPVLAFGGGLGAAFYGVVAAGVPAVMLAGRRREGRDMIDYLVAATAWSATAIAVIAGPFAGVGAAAHGACMILLGAAHGFAWFAGGRVSFAWVGQALLGLGALLWIFGVSSAADARIGGGGVVVAIFLLARHYLRRRTPGVARGAGVVGHLISAALVCAALTLAWGGTPPRLAAAALVVVSIYGALAYLAPGAAARVGVVLWCSVAAVLALPGAAPYREQLVLVALLSLAWFLAGYLLQRRGVATWPAAIYTGATAVAVFCGGISLCAPAEVGSWRVFLVIGALFALLLMVLRRSGFAYLLTLSLSLMAYDWIKSSTSHFTQDLLFYLVVGTGVLGVLFVLPLCKRLVARLGILPVFAFFTWRGAAFAVVPILGLAGLVMSTYSVKITGHPKFCMSCHNMDTFYESWQHSSHADVACVKCHYEPGIEAGVKGKMAGMVQLVKYVSHSYSGQPHAEINNSSCMRVGCHNGMDHSKETLLFRGKVRFSHENHLSGHPRGKELNCVSCHGQTVEGQHIGVTETSCLTCHFYGRGDKPVAAGSCTTCHVTPAQAVTFKNEPFLHREYLEGKPGAQCIHCHSDVTQGDGSVSKTRCHSCHFERQTKQIEDQAEFHLVHVSKGHFDCLQCHDEIKHGDRPMAAQLMTSRNCRNCHEDDRHSLQAGIYTGTAMPDIEEIPDAMYQAGVACDGCHTGAQKTQPGIIGSGGRECGQKGCVDCHNSPIIGRMLTRSQGKVEEQLTELGAQLEALTTQCDAAEKAGRAMPEARQLLKQAQSRLSHILADGSSGAHNNDYVAAILERTETELGKCQALLTGGQTQPE